MTGIKQVDHATHGFFATLPKYGVAAGSISEQQQQQQITNFLYIRRYINRKLDTMPECDAKKSIIRNLDVASATVDTMIENGAQFLTPAHFAGKTQTEQKDNFEQKLKPILDNPEKLKDFTLAMGCVGASYKGSKNDIDFKNTIPLVYLELREKQME